MVDHRSDIFSLGSLLCEMVAGVPPFQGADLGGLLFDAAPPPPSRRNPAVPELLDLITARRCARDPAGRYQDANELAWDLAQCAASVGDLTLPLTAPQRPGLRSESAAFDATQPLETEGSATAAEPTLMQASASSATGMMARSTGGGPAVSGLLPSRHFDSSSAPRRLAQREVACRGHVRRRPRGRTGFPLGSWVVAYLVAGAAAVWIALR